MELNDKYKDIWQRALGEWRAQRDSNPRPLPSEKKKTSPNAGGNIDLQIITKLAGGLQHLVPVLAINVRKFLSLLRKSVLTSL